MRKEQPHGAWVSTAHRTSHRPGGGDEITPADIGAVSIEEFEQLTSGADITELAALKSRVAALEVALDAHIGKKAGQAHK